MPNLTDDELAELTTATLRLAKSVRRELRAEGVKLPPQAFGELAGAIAGELISRGVRLSADSYASLAEGIAGRLLKKLSGHEPIYPDGDPRRKFN
jgi:hypothetical protein